MPDSFVMHQCEYARCGRRHPAHLMTYSDGRWYCKNNGCANLHRAEKIAHEQPKPPNQIEINFKRKQPWSATPVPIDYQHFGSE